MQSTRFKIKSGAKEETEGKKEAKPPGVAPLCCEQKFKKMQTDVVSEKYSHQPPLSI
jgi:hypothetical protein